MATKMLRVCDVCEAPTQGAPIRFGWGTSFYETDLCAAHGEELSSLIEKAIRSAKRLGASAPKAETLSKPSRPARVRRPSTADVRIWAKSKGMKVTDKGRVPETLIAKYLAAH